MPRNAASSTFNLREWSKAAPCRERLQCIKKLWFFDA
jgi:hypothetical protein